MKTILVPVDFSLPSQTAVKLAGYIGQKAKAKIQLMHVVELIRGESFDAEQASSTMDWIGRTRANRLIQQASKKLEFSARTLRNKGLQVSTVLKLGDAAHALRTMVTRLRFDLVIMGTTGRTGLDAAVYGSNTIKVVRGSKSPVLTVHANSKLNACRNIIYPTVLRRGEEPLARTVQGLQRIFNSTLHIVHINTPDAFNSDEAVRKYMESMVRRLKIKNCTINVFNDYSVDAGIFHFAESVNADLIAMAIHKRNTISRFLMGMSIAEGIARNAQLPVLTLGM